MKERFTKIVTAFWVLLGIFVLSLCIGIGKGNIKLTSGGKKAVYRIDHPHLYEDTDYQCSVCGAWFQKDTMTCLRCGSEFTDTENDNTEFDEEMMEEDDWDEEDEE